jgi:hypothetical protein
MPRTFITLSNARKYTDNDNHQELGRTSEQVGTAYSSTTKYRLWKCSSSPRHCACVHGTLICLCTREPTFTVREVSARVLDVFYFAPGRALRYSVIVVGLYVLCVSKRLVPGGSISPRTFLQRLRPRYLCTCFIVHVSTPGSSFARARRKRANTCTVIVTTVIFVDIITVCCRHRCRYPRGRIASPSELRMIQYGQYQILTVPTHLRIGVNGGEGAETLP